jgi:hypothetical protein
MTERTLTDDEKQLLRQCIAYEVEYTKKRMSGYMSLRDRKRDQEYTMELKIVGKYINELSELMKDNPEPLIDTLHQQCITNINNKYKELAELYDMEIAIDEMEQRMSETNDKAEYCTLQYSLRDMRRKYGKANIYVVLTDFTTTTPRGHGFNGKQFLSEGPKIGKEIYLFRRTEDR